RHSRLRAGHADGQSGLDDRPASFRAREERPRVDSARQGKAGPDQLRHCRVVSQFQTETPPTAGPGSNPHIASELFSMMTGTTMTPVHFKGGGPVIIAIMGGEVAFSYLAIAGTSQLIAAGRMRA